MPDGSNVIDEKKVFIDLFDIYEQELLTIFQYVAPINNTCNVKDLEGNECECGCKINFNVSGNKIHELHLRVCAECENLMKLIAKKFYPDRNFDKEYQDKKTKNIMKKLRDFPEKDKQKIKKDLFKYADFQFFLGILNKKLGLCKKKIEFSRFIEVNLNKQISLVQPFERNNSSKSLPKRWDNYNNIKHNKFKNYTNCTLWDLINSLGAYYMLLNYFSMNIKLPVYDEIEVKSKIFKPTIGRLEYPIDISRYYAQYRENKPGFIKDVYIGDKRIIPGYYDENKKEEIQQKLDEALDKFILHDLISKENNKYFSNDNYFFYYSYKQQGIIVQNYINNQTIQQPGRTLRMEKKFNLPKGTNNN